MFIKRSSQSALISIRNLRLASTSSSNPAASTINKPITSNQLPSSQLIKSNREPLKHKAKKSKSSSTSTSITSTLSLNDSNKITNSLKTTNILTNNINNKSNILTELNLLNSNNLNNNNKNNPSSGKAIALSTAESYNIPSLAKTLSLLNINAINLLGEAIYLPKWSPTTTTATTEGSTGSTNEVGEIFVFESGSIVSWGLSSESLEIFLRKVIRSGPELSTNSNNNQSETLLPLEFVEKNRYAEAESEVLEYWIEPNSPTRMQGDSIYLNSSPGTGMNSNSKSSNSSTSDSSSDSSNKERENLLARLAFSAGMSRVTKLGVYEEQFDEFAAGIASIPLQLEQGSESPVKKTDIIKRVGTLHLFRQKLNLEDENLLDEPEFLWENSNLHDYYITVCNTLEFDTRLRTLNQRIEYGFHLQSTLMEILNTKTSHRLEWIIIILIAFEITIVLIREGFALSHESDEKALKKEKLMVLDE